MKEGSRRRFLTFAASAFAAAARGARALDKTSPFSGAPAPDDPLERLYSRKLSFEQGEPLVTVRIAEGRTAATLRPRSPLIARARTSRGEMRSALYAGGPGVWTVRLGEGRPAGGTAFVELEQLPFADKEALLRARAAWEARGVPVRVATVGDLYGIAGHVVDTRRAAILADGKGTEDSARAQAKDLAQRFGVRPQIHRELSAHPRGRISLFDPGGKVVANADSVLELRASGGIAVDEVEYGIGYAFHGFEMRQYPGLLYACADAAGQLALVAAVPMERLVKGVVPSEIFARAHLEALKAQAVTARGEVLAKVGARHLGDPYLLCAEQHCQVYKGVLAEERTTDRAVDATRGEALFALSGEGAAARLVDSVYSAVCGGFTEDNDAVWGGPSDPSLRGRPDFELARQEWADFRDGIGEALVDRFVRAEVPTYCALSGMAAPGKVRWTRSFTAAEMDELCAPLDVGAVRALAVEGRGVSGRARSLRVTGERGSARIDGELAIRRLLRNLNSAMFVVERQGEAWMFTGGGWGHGSGMCQTGAIGRAQRGASYREILAWYYSGARPERIY